MKLRKIIKGLTILLIGLILLANTLGIFEWSVWYNVIKLWPLLLVSAGLSIILKERSFSFLGPLIIFLAIIVGVGTSYSGIDFIREVTPEVKTLSREMIIEVKELPEEGTLPVIETSPASETTSTPEPIIESETPTEIMAVPEIKKAFIELNFDVGTLTLGEPTTLLYECISKYSHKEFEPFEKYSHSGEDAYVTIYHSPSSRKFISKNISNRLQLKLNKEIVYDLHVNTGAIHTECNLSEFKIDELSIESGASNINLVIPEYNSKITIDTGVSNIDIAIPNNVGVMLSIDSGIAVKNLDDFIKENNNYVSGNYDEAEFKTEIKIDCGVSNINVDYIDISEDK